MNTVIQLPVQRKLVPAFSHPRQRLRRRLVVLRQHCAVLHGAERLRRHASDMARGFGVGAVGGANGLRTAVSSPAVPGSIIVMLSAATLPAAPRPVR